MMKSITVTNYLGDSIKLELRRPELTGLCIKSITGLGPTKANINITEVSTMDGGVLNSARLDGRNIVLQLIFDESNDLKESIETLRQKTYKYFPIKKEVTLRIESDNRISTTVGSVESNAPNIFSSQEGTQISIVCPDAFLYSEDGGGTNTTVFYGINSMFEFPFSNESLTEPLIEFSSIENKRENNIIYNGDSEIGVIITMHAIGSASNVSIYNTGTRETMKIDTVKLATLTGSGIINSDEITINTNKGHKGITLLRNGKSINILNCLEKGGSWFSLVRGNNIFAFEAESGSTNLQFRITNQTLYEGV